MTRETFCPSTARTSVTARLPGGAVPVVTVPSSVVRDQCSDCVATEAGKANGTANGAPRRNTVIGASRRRQDRSP
ncbi:MAG: hypothetical protein HQL37_15865 [Alphaproteobacteria bacterium]|nr:hypothetical protein [Alphaproteobacteria bacterium]